MAGTFTSLHVMVYSERTGSEDEPYNVPCALRDDQVTISHGHDVLPSGHAECLQIRRLPRTTFNAGQPVPTKEYLMFFTNVRCDEPTQQNVWVVGWTNSVEDAERMIEEEMTRPAPSDAKPFYNKTRARTMDEKNRVIRAVNSHGGPDRRVRLCVHEFAVQD